MGSRMRGGWSVPSIIASTDVGFSIGFGRLCIHVGSYRRQ